MPAINFKKQFVPLIESGEKRQTIRALRKDSRPICKVGDKLSLYTGMRTKQCRKIMDVRCRFVKRVNIFFDRVDIGDLDIINGEHIWYHNKGLNSFAINDGFESWEKLLEFFQETHGLPFCGWLIQWEDIND